MLGVEIEVATSNGKHAPLLYAAEKWSASIVADGSLPESGYEFVTSPAGGDLFCEQIDEVGAAIREAGGKITGACGLHVHVDARDFTFYDMRRLVMLYASVERALFATQSESRRRSGYCTPCGELYREGIGSCVGPKASKAKLLANVYGKSFAPVVHANYYSDGRSRTFHTKPPRDDKYDSARYRALNLHSWLYRGTVECRLHSGSIEPRKIIPWGVLWAAMLDYAMRATERGLRDVLAPLSSIRDQQRFLLDDVAPTDEVRAYLIHRWNKHNGDTLALPSASVAA